MCRSGAKYSGIRPPNSSRVYFLSIILHCTPLSLLCTHVILWSLLCPICLLIGQHRRIKEFRNLFSLITLYLSRSWKKGLIKKKKKNKTLTKNHVSFQLPKRRSFLLYSLHGVISWFPHLKSDTGTVKSFLSYLNWNPCCPSSRPRIGFISSALFLSKDPLVLFCPGPTFKSPAMPSPLLRSLPWDTESLIIWTAHAGTTPEETL